MIFHDLRRLHGHDLHNLFHHLHGFHLFIIFIIFIIPIIILFFCSIVILTHQGRIS